VAEVNLRAIEKSDLAMIQRWRNSPNVVPYCRQYHPLSMADMEIWYATLSRDIDYNLVNNLFVVEYEDTPVGVGGLIRIDFRNRKGEISFYIGDAEKCTKEIIVPTLTSIVRFGLTTLNLFKVYFPCYAYNPYIKFYKEVMGVDYVAPMEYYWDGVYHDRIVLSSYGILD